MKEIILVVSGVLFGVAGTILIILIVFFKKLLKHQKKWSLK